MLLGAVADVVLTLPRSTTRPLSWVPAQVARARSMSEAIFSGLVVEA